MAESKYESIFKEFKNRETDIVGYGKVLGRGAFGEVRDIKIKNKMMAGKIVEKDKNETSEEEKLALDLRGHNIIRINKIYSRKINNKYFDLIIMDKAVLRDLGKLNEFFHRHNLLKLIFDKPFDDDSGDFLLRFYTRQIIRGYEVLDRNDYIHFDIKPENLLITVNLVIKLSDFSLLKKAEDNMKLPGGTQGFMTPEYFLEKYVKSELAKKQDYFALGSSLFILKYGQQLLKYKKYDDKRMNADRLTDLIDKDIQYIKAKKFTDKDFKDFLISLIQFKPEDRPSFERIFRSIWLNKNIEQLDRTVMAFENDEEKLIMELQKQDFLKEKQNLMEIQNLKEKQNLMEKQLQNLKEKQNLLEIQILMEIKNLIENENLIENQNIMEIKNLIKIEEQNLVEIQNLMNDKTVIEIKKLNLMEEQKLMEIVILLKKQNLKEMQNLIEKYIQNLTEILNLMKERNLKEIQNLIEEQIQKLIEKQTQNLNEIEKLEESQLQNLNESQKQKLKEKQQNLHKKQIKNLNAPKQNLNELKQNLMDNQNLKDMQKQNLIEKKLLMEKEKIINKKKLNQTKFRFKKKNKNEALK